MNKRMIVLIALVVAVSAVPASTETLEVARQCRESLTGANPEIAWNATNFAAFWYDIDDDLMTESLRISDTALDGADPQDREIDENALTYTTSPMYQQYELLANSPRRMLS